jgi:hypothetical protein
LTCSPGKDRAPSPISGWPSRPASAGPRSTGTGQPQKTCSATCCSAELPFFATPALPLRSWLHTELRQLADELALPAVASLAIALMEQTRPGGPGARPHRHITAITERLAAAFALAVDAGELDTAPDAGPGRRAPDRPAGLPDHPASRGGTRQLLAELIDSAAHWRAPDPARSRPTSAPGQPTATTPGSSPPS